MRAGGQLLSVRSAILETLYRRERHKRRVGVDRSVQVVGNVQGGTTGLLMYDSPVRLALVMPVARYLSLDPFEGRRFHRVRFPVFRRHV